MDPYLFDPLAQKRRELFQENGWGEPPYDAEERYALARQEMQYDGVQNFERALALYDPIVDCQNWRFAEFVADLYENSDSPYHDLKVAEKHYRRAFELAEGEDDHRNAWFYLRAYFKRNSIETEDLPALYQDSFAFTGLLVTVMHGWDLPYPMDWDKTIRHKNVKERYAPYFLGCFVGAGNGAEQDHEQAVDIYKAYIEETDQGLCHAPNDCY